MLSSLSAVRNLLNDILRVTVTDGRIFLGTFVGTDSELNILLLNTDEFRLGPNENPNGRFVGQVMIPWRLVKTVEARLSPQSPDGMFT
jgi:N-alpha-acetyltransferase 38, NatC auxiliary subunit